MNLRSKLARITTLLFSLTLLAGYVVYSHVTPNTPPPDPLGLNEVESRQEPDASAFDGTVKADNTPPSSERPANELRIISSKVINQPVFSVRRIRLPWETTRRSWSRRDPFTDKPEIDYKGFGISLKALHVE
jgi:hypothetical protein